MGWCGPVVLSPTGHSQKSCGWNTCLQNDDGDLVCYAPVLIQVVRKNSADITTKKLRVNRKNSFWLFLSKKTLFREKSIDSQGWEKGGSPEVKRWSDSREKADSDFPYLVYVCNFFSIKWVFVLMLKQRLRVFYEGNIARLDLFTNHDASNDSFWSSQKGDLLNGPILIWLRKARPIPNLVTAISQSETNQCQSCAALWREG